MGSTRSDSEESDSSDGASNWRRGKTRKSAESRKSVPEGHRKSSPRASPGKFIRAAPSREHSSSPSTSRKRSTSREDRRSPVRERRRSASREGRRSPVRERRRSASRESRRSPLRGRRRSASRTSPKSSSKSRRRRSRSMDEHRSSPRRRDRNHRHSRSEDRRRRDRSSSKSRKSRHDKSSRRERSTSPSVSDRRRSESAHQKNRDSSRTERERTRDRRKKNHRSTSGESRTSARKHSVERRKRSSSTSSDASPVPDASKGDQREKYDNYLESEQTKGKEDKKKLKALMKQSETPEQKRARRLAKKEAKERRRKREMGWNDELVGYTNQDNPFGDSNLQQTFKWGKKLEKEGMKDINDEQLEKISRRKREEQRQELEKVKERRLERERERAEREQLLEMEQRKREGAQFDEWAKQEDTFHLQQAKLRSKIRIEEGRAKPIDLLARYISAEEEDFSVEMIEPYLYLNGLSLDDFEDLIEDINVYMRLESRKNQEYWNDIRIIVDEETRKLKKPENDENSSGRQIISSEVNKDIVDVFRGKTPKQLEVLKTSIEAKLKNKGPGLDVAYWETLLSRLRSYMAHARLRERHEENLRKKLAQLKQEQGVEIKQEHAHTDEHSQDSVTRVSSPPPQEAGTSSADADNDPDANEEIDPLQQSIIDYEQGRYTPTLLKASELELGTLLTDPREDEQRRAARINLTAVGKTETLTKIEEIFEREARKDMDDSEAQFSVEQLIDAQTYQWSDMYRPRKPRYFNRVHTGFEWNKYNQTHYDIDNPPPKIVQGYKFNIFYPDLIDKNVTPQYSLTACADNPDFSVLRFHAGPPYEDIAFKVVNREWEYSYKKGFRCQFHNDIFQLWFHFKRMDREGVVRFRNPKPYDPDTEGSHEVKSESPGDDHQNSDSVDKGSSQTQQSEDTEDVCNSFWEYLHGEFRRGYYLENDEQRYEDRREKFYMFFKIPKEFEKFQFYGLVQCVDAFLFVFTLLPVRFVFGCYAGLSNWIKVNLNKLSRQCSSPVHNRRLQPAETCDLIKGLIILIVAYMATYIDTSVLYHVVKTQSVIKLYIFFNMLEVADRLFSNFGQDIIDALFWTATEPKGRLDGRSRFGIFSHFVLAVLYVFFHCCLVMLQAVALNVAINSQSKGLLAIMMSNNFVELKGMVFKKFEKNNLFQMSCSDVRERFHYMVLLFVVVLQTMKEYSWQLEPFWELLPSCFWVMVSEILVDWVKHAFVTRFNDIHYSMYSEYITYLAYDVASSKLKNAYSDHSDLVARRMAFIPLPLGALVLRVVLGSVAIKGHMSIFLALLFWLMLFSCKVVVNIFLLGRACVIIERHRQSLNEKKPTHRLCTSLPSSRRQSMEDLKPDLVKSEVKSEPQSANASVSSSLADIRDQAELASQSMNEAPIFAESAVDISTLGIKEEVLGENVDQLKENLLEIKNRGRSISTGMLPGLPLQDKNEL